VNHLHTPVPEDRRRYGAELAPNRVAPRTARAIVGCVLEEWNLLALADDAGLLASELVTNAILHGGSSVVRFSVQLHPPVPERAEQIVLAVWDGGDGTPQLADPDGNESGRGLHLVEEIATEWGYTLTNPGKIVWAKLGPKPKEIAA
jgi:sigma-B regulation protein RsbU (phosphoserine phosphatase)